MPQNLEFIKCPSCKGKGHVYDASSILLIGLGWIMGPLERNNPDGLTRERCGQCNGRGYVYGVVSPSNKGGKAS